MVVKMKFKYLIIFILLITSLGFSEIILEGDKYHSKTIFTFKGNNIKEVKLPVDIKYFKNLKIRGSLNYKIVNSTIYFDKASNVSITGELPIYICDYSPMPNMSGRDVYIVDICSACPKVVINEFKFYNLTALKNRSIDYIIYYPYTKANQEGLWKDYFRLDDFDYFNHTLIINKPLIVYRSEHSNVFALVLDKPENSNKSNSNNLLFDGLLIVAIGLIIYLIYRSR